MSKGTCKNCGADESIHQYETMRCPWGGYEAPIGQKERWSTQTFEEDKSNELAALRSQLATVTAELEAMREALKKADDVITDMAFILHNGDTDDQEKFESLESRWLQYPIVEIGSLLDDAIHAALKGGKG